MTEILFRDNDQTLARLTGDDHKRLEEMAVVQNVSPEQALSDALTLAHTVANRWQLGDGLDEFVEDVQTPWGIATEVRPMGPGITFVRTPRTYGLHLREPALSLVPDAVLNLMSHPCWVEDRIMDVEVALVALNACVDPALLKKALPHLMETDPGGGLHLHARARDAISRYGRYMHLQGLMKDIPSAT